MLMENGLDSRLAYHISTLFIRAPIPVYQKELMFPCCQNKCLQPGEKESPVDSPARVTEKQEKQEDDIEESKEPVIVAVEDVEGQVERD